MNGRETTCEEVINHFISMSVT